MSEQPSAGKSLALTGAFLQLGPLAGAGVIAVATHRAYETLGTSAPGAGDPVELSAAIGDVLIWGFVGCVLGLSGLVLLCLALLGARYRATWFFWFLVVYGGVLLPFFPVGTAVGVFFIGTCLERRREFHRSRGSEPSPGLGG